MIGRRSKFYCFVIDNLALLLFRVSFGIISFLHFLHNFIQFPISTLTHYCCLFLYTVSPLLSLNTILSVCLFSISMDISIFPIFISFCCYCLIQIFDSLTVILSILWSDDPSSSLSWPKKPKKFVKFLKIPPHRSLCHLFDSLYLLLVC